MRHLTLAAIAVMLLAACGASTTTTPPPTPPLADREFWSTAITGHDLVPDTRIRLSFRGDGTMGAGAGCNSMGGIWRLDGTTLLVEVGAMTEMGCPDDRMAQDDWLTEFLAAGLTATIDGDELVLTGAGVTVTLLDREVADPDQPLEGTTWVLDGLQTGAGNDGAVSSVPSGVHATVTVDGGQLNVDTGCNTGAASVTVDGDTFTIGSLALTERACEPNATEVERFMTLILQGEVQASIDGRSLRLTGPTGGLMFQAE